MAPKLLPDNSRPWSWTQFAIALGLFPVSFLLWLVGMTAVFGPEHNPIALVCLIASPFIAIAGAIWLLVLVVRRFTTGRRSRMSLIIGVPSLALGLFFGLVTFESPPGREGEALVFGVLSGILLFAALVCALCLVLPRQ